VKRALVCAVLVALAFAPSALACNAHPTLPALEGQVMCPVCGTTLDQSDSPAAQQIKRAIRTRIAAGESDCQIKDALVANYGPAILAAPQKSGFGLLAWWVPIGAIVFAAVAIGLAAWRWTRRREPEATFDPARNGHAALDPALERRLDEELARFDG
jgi:cytochrome c-type biogenesis protein CcmH